MLGPYELLSSLGAGGMGEVYRARDTRLSRDHSARLAFTQLYGCHPMKGVRNLYQKFAGGAGNEEVLLKTSEDKVPNDWSSDGQFIVYQNSSPKTKWDLWVLPMSGERKQFPFLQTEFNEQQAQFSPDGKWIAYTSDESGAPEVYIQTFPAS